MLRTNKPLSPRLHKKVARPLLHAHTLTATGSPLTTQKPRADFQARAARTHWISEQMPKAYRQAVFCPSFAQRLQNQFPEWDLKKTTPPNNHAVSIWAGLSREQKLIWQSIKDEAHRLPDFLLPEQTLVAKTKVPTTTLARVLAELENAGAISRFSVLTFRTGVPIKETFILPRLFFVGDKPQMLPPDQWLTRLVENRYARLSNEEKRLLTSVWDFYNDTSVWPTPDELAHCLNCSPARITPILEHLLGERLLLAERIDNKSKPNSPHTFLIPTCDALTLPLLPDELDNVRRDVTRSWVAAQNQNDDTALTAKESQILDILLERLTHSEAPPVMAELAELPELGLSKKANIDNYMERLKAKGMIKMLPNPMPGSRSLIIIVLQTSRGPLSDFEIQTQLRLAHNPANWARFLKDLSRGLYDTIASTREPLTFEQLRPLFKQNPPRNIQKSLERLTRDGFLKIVSKDGEDAYAIHQNGGKTAMLAFQAMKEASELALSAQKIAHVPDASLEKRIIALLHEAVFREDAPHTLLGIAELLGIDKSSVHHAVQVLEASGHLMTAPDPLPTSKAYLLILLREPSGQFLNPRRVREQIAALHNKENWIPRLSLLQRALLSQFRKFDKWINVPLLERYLRNHRPDVIENACDKLVELGFLKVRLSASGNKSYFPL